ncbi:MAG: vWA domain-containing protein [bacterium]|jgi:Ca-activated chloride channel family protein
MREYHFSEYRGDDEEDLIAQMENLLERLKDYLFLTDGDVREALEMMKEAGEFGEGEEADQMVEQILKMMEQSDLVDSEGKVKRLSENGLRLLSEKTLEELLSSIQKSHSGHHETVHKGMGDVFNYETRPWAFGDHLDLDISRTFQNAFIRRGIGFPIDLEREDLEIIESEHQSQCATVLMLDISHSMILYGEDRFTPAKKVALALAHLIRTRYPQDSLSVLLFFDDAREIPLHDLISCQVGPYYTNTKAGLALAQRILSRTQSENKQIIMITDGKPSAIWHQGQIVRHSWWDPWIISETLREAEKCRAKRISINTFMLARDYALMEFVHKQTQITRGKAYFTSPQTLGQYLLVDYMNQRRRSNR